LIFSLEEFENGLFFLSTNVEGILSEVLELWILDHSGVVVKAAGMVNKGKLSTIVSWVEDIVETSVVPRGFHLFEVSVLFEG